MTQLSFAPLEFTGKKKQTKRDVFLPEISSAVPWELLTAQIELYCPSEDRHAELTCLDLSDHF